jgi:hypothetical protein
LETLLHYVINDVISHMYPPSLNMCPNAWNSHVALSLQTIISHFFLFICWPFLHSLVFTSILMHPLYSMRGNQIKVVKVIWKRKINWEIKLPNCSWQIIALWSHIKASSNQTMPMYVIRNKKPQIGEICTWSFSWQNLRKKIRSYD